MYCIIFCTFFNKLISEFCLEKPPHIYNNENIYTKKDLTIPVSINEDYLGKPLSVDIYNGIITKINLTIKYNDVNFLDIIKNKAKLLRAKHKDNITYFDEKFKFYLLNDKSLYVLAVKIHESYIDKIRYYLDGVIISHVIDNIENNLIIRQIGEKRLVLHNNEVVSVEQKIKFKSIDKLKSKTLFV